MGSAGVLNSCRQFSWVPLSPRPRAQLEFYPIVPQGSCNTLPAITSGAFLPRACSLGHTLPYIARNGAGTFLHKSCRGASMSIVGDTGLAVFVLLFAFGMADLVIRS